MDGGAWPFLVRGVICLLDCDNGRDLVWMLLGPRSTACWDPGPSATAVCVLTRGSSRLKQVCDALRCSGPHARYNGRDSELVAGGLARKCWGPGAWSERAGETGKTFCDWDWSL